jgi:hypothetical protein
MEIRLVPGLGVQACLKPAFIYKKILALTSSDAYIYWLTQNNIYPYAFSKPLFQFH